MKLSKKLFLMGVLLCLALVSRSQTLLEPVAQKDLFKDACGKNGALPFSMPSLNSKEDATALRKLGCNYAMGPSLPKELAEELKSLVESPTGFKSSKNLHCDFLNPFDLKALFDSKEQQKLNTVINETFHK